MLEQLVEDLGRFELGVQLVGIWAMSGSNRWSSQRTATTFSGSARSVTPVRALSAARC